MFYFRRLGDQKHMNSITPEGLRLHGEVDQKIHRYFRKVMCFQLLFWHETYQMIPNSLK